MHRSGTSALTRALNLLGASLGDESDLYVAHDNPEGHWESAKLIACNDQILNAFGGSWAAPPWLVTGWERSPVADALVPGLRESFAVVYDGVPSPWLWKDPRTCLTLPLWRRVVGEFVVVLVLRDPARVAASLNRRDRFRFGYAMALWEYYNRSAVDVATALPVVVVRFEDLISRPQEALRQLTSDLCQLGVDLTGSVDAAARSLRSTDRGSPDVRVGRRQRDLADLLAGLPRLSTSFAPPRVQPTRWRQLIDFGPLSYPWGPSGGRRYPMS